MITAGALGAKGGGGGGGGADPSSYPTPKYINSYQKILSKITIVVSTLVT